MAPNSRGHYRALPIIANPFSQEEDPHGHGQGNGCKDHSSRQPLEIKGEEHNESITVRGGEPVYRHSPEASKIELFYDLFFVANLTSFTSNHPIDSRDTLSSYMGFFSILWFTWLQVVLYDVRFGVDSLYERIRKLVHFGVMVGFAIVGNSFQPGSSSSNYHALRQISLILIVSRVNLITQYGYLLYWAKGYTKKVKPPILMHMAAFAIGELIILGVFFTFKPGSPNKAYICWYFIIFFEALAVFISSSRWQAISFERTSLIERCGLLTLIILGEGIIVLTKAMNYAVTGQNISPAIIGQIISAVLIIYFLYMLYFDQIDKARFGTVRQQFWALWHFPFHVSLVLLMEGTARLITWRNAVEITNTIITDCLSIYNSTNDTIALASALNNKSSSTLQRLKTTSVTYNVTGYLNDLATRNNTQSDEARADVYDTILTLTKATFSFFQISTSETPSSNSRPDLISDIYQVFKVYDLVFSYFFITAGFTLIIMAILVAVAQEIRCAGDYAAIVLRLVIGTGLAMVTIIKTDSNARDNFISSAWMVPTVLLALFFVVVVDGVLAYILPAAPNVQIQNRTHESHGDAA